MKPNLVTRRPAHYYAYLRSVQWKGVRHDYLKRVGWRCERCHVRKVYLVHHLHYDSLGCEQPQDLMALCYECHEVLHRWPKPANDNQMRLPLGEKEFEAA